MAKSKVTFLAPEVISKMEITKEDLVAIAMAKKERELMTARAAKDREIKDVASQIQNSQKEIAKSVDLAVNAAAKTAGEAVVATLKVHGWPDANYAVTHSFTDKQINYNLQIKTADKNSRYNDGGISQTQILPFTDDQVSINEKIVALNEKYQSIQNEAVEIRKEIGNMPSLERQARAALAARVLENTEEGRALLDSISDIKSLPMS